MCIEKKFEKKAENDFCNEMQFYCARVGNSLQLSAAGAAVRGGAAHAKVFINNWHVSARAKTFMQLNSEKGCQQRNNVYFSAIHTIHKRIRSIFYF